MMSRSKVILNEKRWKTFSKILQGLSKGDNDVTIVDGVIRQRSCDGAAIVEVDMAAMLAGSTFTITNIKEEIKRLKDLSGDVSIETDQQKVVFSDGDSSYRMPAPDQNYLNMSKPEMDSLLSSVSQSTTPLLKYTIHKKNLKRIRNALSTFRTSSYRVIFEGHSASLTVEGYGGSKGLRPCMEVIKNIPLSEPTRGSMNLANSPYQSFDFDADIEWEVYREGDKFLSKHSGQIGDVTAVTYTRGELKKDEPEPSPQAGRNTEERRGSISG